MSDSVNHPRHYTGKPIETIDIIRNELGEEGFKAYCRGQVLKYISRAGKKLNEQEDYAKARWYLEKLVEISG